MTTTATDLATIAEMVRVAVNELMSSRDAGACSDHDLIALGAALAQLYRSGAAGLVEVAGEAQKRSESPARHERFAVRYGCANVNEFMQRLAGVSGATSAAWLRAVDAVGDRDTSTGLALDPHLPGMREVFSAGLVSVDGLNGVGKPLLEAQPRAHPDMFAEADASVAGMVRDHDDAFVTVLSGGAGVGAGEAGASADWGAFGSEGLGADCASGCASAGCAGSECAVGCASVGCANGCASAECADGDGSGRELGGHGGSATVRVPMPVNTLKAVAEVWAQALDQDGAEPKEARAARKRSFSIGLEHDGLVRVNGFILPDVAATLRSMFDAINNPRVNNTCTGDGGGCLNTGDAAGSSTGGTSCSHAGSCANHLNRSGVFFTDTEDTAQSDTDTDTGASVDGDTRTAAQKRHDAFATIVSVASGSSELPTIGGAAPTLVVHVKQEDFLTGSGWATVDDIGVSTRVARHTGCTGAIQRVILDEHGAIVSIHTNDRIFNRHQRRAITARDKQCVIPGCGVTARWCEIHHVTEHARGGQTHTNNGVLLCWHHHRYIETNGWQIRMNRGTPETRAPHWLDPTRQWRATQPPPPSPRPPRGGNTENRRQ